MRLISADLATVLALRQIPHIYQQLYHAFYRRPSHHQEGMVVHGMSNQIGEEEEEEEADNFKAEEAVVGVVEDSAE